MNNDKRNDLTCFHCNKFVGSLYNQRVHYVSHLFDAIAASDMGNLSIFLQHLLEFHSEFDLFNNNVFKSLWAREEHKSCGDQDSFFQATAKAALILFRDRTQQQKQPNFISNWTVVKDTNCSFTPVWSTQSYANLEQKLIWSSENGQCYDLNMFDVLPTVTVDKDIQSPCKVESIDGFTVACDSSAPNFSSAAYFNSNAALLPAPPPPDSIQSPLINSGDTSQIFSINKRTNIDNAAAADFHHVQPPCKVRKLVADESGIKRLMDFAQFENDVLANVTDGLMNTETCITKSEEFNLKAAANKCKTKTFTLVVKLFFDETDN